MNAQQIRERFAARGYITDDDVATSLELMLALEKPLLVEGPAGVGKTESAKVLADVLDTKLIRLQCYEGLDAASALYEWNYPKQLLHIRLTEHQGASVEEREAHIFGSEFLLARPLLEAIRQERAPVLLIDEIDRADEAFEAFLLEILSEFQVTIPELGTVQAKRIPHVILTSNSTRELSDALKRRCLYHWIDYPSLEKETEIVRTRIPEFDHELGSRVVRFMQLVRRMNLSKPPGVAETLDLSQALILLKKKVFDPETAEEILGCVLK